jgi:hypothetical protein
MSIYHNLHHLSEDHHRALWGSQEFYRAISLVNGGRRLETDLFEGLRDSESTLQGAHETGKWREATPQDNRIS